MNFIEDIGVFVRKQFRCDLYHVRCFGGVVYDSVVYRKMNFV